MLSRIEIPSGARIIARRSNACFSKFHRSNYGPPSPHRLSIGDTRNEIYVARRHRPAVTKSRLKISRNSNLIAAMIFLLIIQGRVAGDPIDPIDRDLARAKEVGGARGTL